MPPDDSWAATNYRLLVDELYQQKLVGPSVYARVYECLENGEISTAGRELDRALR